MGGGSEMVLKRFTFEKRITGELNTQQGIPADFSFSASGNTVEIHAWDTLSLAVKNAIRALMQTNGLGEEPDIPEVI